MTELRSTARKESNTELIPFVSTHNPYNPDIFNVIKANLPVLQKTKKLKKLFPTEKFLKSKRQPLNLKKILTRAKFYDPNGIQYNVSKCNDPRCGLCEYMAIGPQITLKNGQTIVPNADINCKNGMSSNIFCLLALITRTILTYSTS